MLLSLAGREIPSEFSMLCNILSKDYWQNICALHLIWVVAHSKARQNCTFDAINVFWRFQIRLIQLASSAKLFLKWLTFEEIHSLLHGCF